MSAWSRWHCTFASAALFCLSHGYLPHLAWIAPLWLLLALARTTLRASFYHGLACGIGEAAIMAGLMLADIRLFVALCLIYGLWRAAFAMLVAWSRALQVTSTAASLLPACLFTLSEFLHTQVPYSLPNLLGDTQHVGPLLPLARLGGTYLIGFFIVWGSSAVAQWYTVTQLAERPWRLGAKPLGVCLVALALCLVAAHMTAPQPVSAHAIRVNIVQGGIPAWLYEQSDDGIAKHALPWRVYRERTLASRASDLVVWPETALPSVWGESQWEGAPFATWAQAIAEQHASALLLGSARREIDGTYYNSAILVDGSHVDVVDKRRLALHVESQFAPALQSHTMLLRGHRLGVVFCLESVVPQYAAEMASQNATALVVLVDGTRFGLSPVGRMHAQRSVIRAVETGLPVIHAGQHGFSTVIQPDGEHLPLAPAFHARVVESTLGQWTPKPPFVRFGMTWLVGPVAVALLWLLRHWPRNRRNAMP